MAPWLDVHVIAAGTENGAVPVLDVAVDDPGVSSRPDVVEDAPDAVVVLPTVVSPVVDAAVVIAVEVADVSMGVDVAEGSAVDVVRVVAVVGAMVGALLVVSPTDVVVVLALGSGMDVAMVGVAVVVVDVVSEQRWKRLFSQPQPSRLSAAPARSVVASGAGVMAGSCGSARRGA